MDNTLLTPQDLSDLILIILSFASGFIAALLLHLRIYPRLRFGNRIIYALWSGGIAALLTALWLSVNSERIELSVIVVLSGLAGLLNPADIKTIVVGIVREIATGLGKRLIKLGGGDEQKRDQ